MTSPTTIAFEGELTIRTIGAAAERLREGLAVGGPVEVDCRAVAETDLCFVQLLLAARRSALRQRTRLTLSAPVAGPLLACLKSGGFLGDGPDMPLSSEARFWMRKEEADV